MEIASLILGIVSLILSFVPFVGIIAYLPALIGLVLGVVALSTMKSRGKNKKSMPIIGIVMSGVSMVLALVMVFVWSIIGIGYFSNMANKNDRYNSIYNSIYNNVENKVNNDDYGYDYDDDDYYTDLDDMREYRVGQEINLDDIKLVVNKIEKFSGSSNLKAVTGKELILVDVTITNNSRSKKYITMYDFEINDGDNYSFPKYDSTHKDATFQSEYLDSNKSMTGTICFEKEKYNDDYYLVYNEEVKVKIDL